MNLLEDKIKKRALITCRISNNIIKSINPQILIYRDCNLNALFTLWLADELNINKNKAVFVASAINLISFYSLDTDRFLDSHIDRIKHYRSYTFKDIKVSDYKNQDKLLLIQSSYMVLLDLQGFFKLTREYLIKYFKNNQILHFESEICKLICLTDYGMYLDHMYKYMYHKEINSNKAVKNHLNQGITFHMIPYTIGYLFNLKKEKIDLLKKAFSEYGYAFIYQDDIIDIHEDNKIKQPNNMNYLLKKGLNKNEAKEKMITIKNKKIKEAINYFKRFGIIIEEGFLKEHIEGWTNKPRKGFFGELTEYIIDNCKLNSKKPA